MFHGSKCLTVLVAAVTVMLLGGAPASAQDCGCNASGSNSNVSCSVHNVISQTATNVCTNPATAVTLGGEYFYEYHCETKSNGDSHVKWTTHFKLTGTDAHGINYVGQDSQNYDVKMDPDCVGVFCAPTSDIVTSDKYKLIAQGPTPDMTITSSTHIQVNADNTTVADVVAGPTIKCSGPPLPVCAANGTVSTNRFNFNGTAIPAGDYIWFNANFTASGMPAWGGTISFQNATISFGNLAYANVPGAQITFSPSVTSSTTRYDSGSNTWITTVPVSGSDEIFLSGYLLGPVPSGGLPGGINPVSWTGTFINPSGVAVNWKWSAAVYTKNFSTDYNALAVKPTHNGALSYNNSDHAGTPEGSTSTGTPFKSFVTGGAGGGGGSNFTGGWSGTVIVAACF